MKVMSRNQSFLGQFPDSKYCDVNLSTQDGAGQLIAAHKVVLAAVSAKLEKLFDDAGEGVGPVVVRNIKYEVLRKIVEYIYFGKVQIGVSDVENEDFQDGLDMLRVKVKEQVDQSEALQIENISVLSNISSQDNLADVQNNLTELNTSSSVSVAVQHDKEAVSVVTVGVQHHKEAVSVGVQCHPEVVSVGFQHYPEVVSIGVQRYPEVVSVGVATEAPQLRNPSTMDFPFWNPTNSELQVPATHASSAHQAPRFVQTLSGASRVLVVRPHAISHDTLQPTTTKKGVPFSTRGWPTGPWQWAARDISM